MKRLVSVVGSALLSIASVVMLTLPVATTHAQNSGNGFVVSPVRSELTLDPGKSQVVTLTVENATGGVTTAKAIVNDFEPSGDENGQPRILLDDKAAPSNSFKSLVGNIPNTTLNPGEKKNIDVRITVPGNANAGGYYGAIRFVSDNGSSNDKNVALSASVGTIFLVRVTGSLTESLQLVEFTAAKNSDPGRFFINSGKMSIITRLKNTGNIHVKPFGRVQVTDRSGKIVQEYEFNNTDPRANVLPNSTRKFEDQLKNQNWIGKYTITANLGYGTSGSLITAKNTFWVIPAWSIAVLAGIVVLFLVLGFFIYRKLSTRSKHTAKVRR
ncbi:MAG: hypothetical protein U0491_02965 [Candidatus Saccharimonadales bacterium]